MAVSEVENANGTKSQEAYRRIKAALDSGHFKPGERLIEARVCRDLNLKRGPVREALLLLHGEGLVRKEGAYKGHIVEFTEDIPPDQLLFRYELREQIAGGACRLAAKNMNGWQIDTIHQLAKALDEAQEADDRESRYAANYRFHECLLNNCGNPLFLEVWESHRLVPTRPRSQEFEDAILGQLEADDEPKMEAIALAIAAHDQAEAESLMKKRVNRITEAIRKVVHGTHQR